MSDDFGLYPITLRSERMRALVVGGGPIGARKIGGLLRAGIEVVLVAPDGVAPVQEWASLGTIEWRRRVFIESDLEGVNLVFVATNHRAVNRAVAARARARNLLVNVADAPGEGNFHVPASCEVDDMLVAVSSRAQRPRQSQALRDRIQDVMNHPSAAP